MADGLIHVHIGRRLSENVPIIDLRFFEDEGDREATAPALGVARELFASSPLADYVLEEEFPGPAVCSPDEVLRHAFESGGIGIHAVGACAMGPNSDDVGERGGFQPSAQADRVILATRPDRFAGGQAPDCGTSLGLHGCDRPPGNASWL